jgi:uncharacterized membrane protein YphA (DoxX/SURF4 family)
MSKLILPGRIMFACGIIALGVVQFIVRDFIVGRPPASTWAADIPGKLAWAYTSGSLFIIAGLAIIFNLQARLAALVIGVMILVFSFLLRHLYEMTDWGNAYKSLALSGGAFIVAVSFRKKEGGNSRNFFTNHDLVFAGCIFLSLFFIICGFLHFKFFAFVKDFIPSYIPFHGFWAYFCGICLLAGGTGFIFTKTRKWAALLSGIMVLGWFILLHIHRFIVDMNNDSDRMGICEAFALSGILFVLAGISSEEKFSINTAGPVTP